MTYMIHSKEDFEVAIKSFAFASFIYTLLFIPLVDISALSGARVADAMSADDSTPNVNVISMCSSFACILFAFFGLSEKKITYYLIAIAAFVFTVILGSRKSLLSVLLFLLVIFYKTSARNKSKLLTYGLFTLLAMMIIIPKDYLQFIIERFGVLDYFVSGNKIVIDESDNNRLEMLNHGITYFSNKPLFGNGYMNFAILFHRDGYMLTYSHNNFIEILADLGIVGFIIYYIPFISILRNIRKSQKSKWTLLFGTLIVVILFNSLFIVFISTRFMWLLLAILYAGSCYCKHETSLID